MLQARPNFESAANQQLIVNTIVKDFANSDPLSDEEYARLPRMIKHYMGQVREVHGNKPVTLLNHEVMRACVQQLLTMRDTRPAPAAPADPMMVDTSRRFEQIQTERNAFMKRDTPPAPNFMIEANEDRTSAMELFQRAKAARDEEMKLNAEKNAVFQAQSAGSPAPVYQPSFQPMNTRDSLVLGQGQAHADIRDIIRQPQPTLQQDILQRKTDVLSYKENEYNLFINSADRNWFVDTELNYATKKENRYDFSVSFNPANNRHGFSITPEAQIKFKNISRVELVKAIIPNESIDIFKTQYATDSRTTFDSGVNVLSLPYLMVRVDELDSNNYGTNNGIDAAFGLIQYDNKWNPETVDYREYSNSVQIANPGYVCMIPKFIKCQRVYDPTPLSTLQRMSVRIERPDKTLVNGDMDTFDFNRIFLASDAAAAGYGYAAGNPFGTVAGSDYLMLESKSVFNGASVIAGDRIYIKGYQIAGASTAQQRTFMDFVNRAEGHVVSAVQGLGVGGVTITEKPNKLGYSKFIVIQGIPNVDAGDYEDLSAIATDIRGVQACCRGLNGSRQVQLVFRITTKEIDSSSHLRPDII